MAVEEYSSPLCKQEGEKDSAFFFFSPFFLFLEIFGFVCPVGDETKAFWFFLYGVPDSINVVPQPQDSCMEYLNTKVRHLQNLSQSNQVRHGSCELI